MAGGDRISDLPDDLLRRILYFAPLKEAASTSALARRWRSLWLSSSAVNLDTRSYRVQGDHLYGKRAAFVRDAHAALDARGRHCPLRKLTLHVEGHRCDVLQLFLRVRDGGLKDDIVDAVLSHRAARSVEELCVDACVSRLPYEDRRASAYYDLSLASLPSMNLRRLRISGCKTLRVPPAASAPVAFPRLEELRLHFCTDVPLHDLQSVVDSAPHLAVLDLHSVCLSSPQIDVPGAATHEGAPPPPANLRCPAVTALVISDCTWTNRTGVELDAPMLRCFRHNGNFREPFALKPQAAANLTRVDIGFSPDTYYYMENGTCACFWQCAASLSNARVLKLKTNQLEHLRPGRGTNGPELNEVVFRDLERLELEAQYKPGRSKHTGAAIAHLLHCCPVIRQLRINLSTSEASEIKSYTDDGYYERDVFAEKDQLDFDKSVNRFLRRRFKNPMVSYEVPVYIHGLNGQSFTCLQSSLRWVSLRFRRDESNRFGVRLAKFLAENARVLEEMHIDDGNQKIWEHINRVVGRSVAGSASGFAVLPLEG